MEQSSQLPNLLVGFFVVQQFIVPSARSLRDCREDSLIRKAAIQLDLHVAGSLVLLEDQVVHSAACFSQRGGQDRKAAALFDVSGSSRRNALAGRALRDRAPPASVRPLGFTARFDARVYRVRLSIRTTTSLRLSARQQPVPGPYQQHACGFLGSRQKSGR